MSTKGLIAGTVMLLVSLSVAAMESSLLLPNGKPGQTEFVTAAKRALVSRHY